MRPAAVLGWILAGVAVGAAQQIPPNPPVFRSDSTELVVVPIVVTDRDGEFVEELTSDRFTVLDNGRPQAISFFTSEDTPVSVALVVDASGSMRDRMGQLVAAGSAFARASHPEDELFVVAFNDRAFDPLHGGTIGAGDDAALVAALTSLIPRGRTALYDGLLSALQRLGNARHARRVLVLISDGGDNASRATRDDVLDHARRSNVTIYTLGAFERRARDANPGMLQDLARATGGQRFLPRSPGELLQACVRVAREIRTGYVIGYEPPERDGAFHRIDVRVKDDGRQLRIRTRPGYFAAGTSSHAEMD